MSAALPARAQAVAVWPEVDVFVRLNSTARVLLVATTVRDQGDLTTGSLARVSISTSSRSADHQLDTGNSPNKKTRAVGAVSTFYF